MKHRTLHTALGIAALCLIAWSIVAAPELSAGFTLAAIGAYTAGDALLSVTRALPNGAASVTSTSIDLGHGSFASNVAEHEFLIEAPALTTAQLPDTKTIIYDVVTSASSDLSSPTVVSTAVLTQTGAGGAGAAAATQRFRLPTDCQRYVGIKATNSGTGNASGVSATLSLKF